MKKFAFLGHIGALIGSSLIVKPSLGPTGTYSFEWLKEQRGTRLNTLPVEGIQAVVQTELAAHNLRFNQMAQAYTVRVERRDGVDATGQSLTGTMVEVDEFGRARTQVPGKPGDVNHPLRRFQFSAGFTADFFRKRTAADLIAVLENAQAAHRGELINQIRQRLYSPANYDFEDRLVDRKILKIKALYNADGTLPPMNRNGTSYSGTHTHYLGFTSWTDAGMRQTVNTVREHGDGGEVQIHISAINEGDMRGLTGFTAAVDIQVQAGANERSTRQGLTYTNTGNRYIGRYEGCDVWVKPWAYDHYALAVDMTNPPLAIRHPDDVEDEGLRMIGQIANFPLQSEFWGAEFGIGTQRRGGAAVAQMNAPAAGVYQDPTGATW